MRLLSLLSIVMLLSACATTRTLFSMQKSTGHFLVLENDRRILYEPGAERMAEQVSQALDKAIKSVEQKQYRKFSKPVIVHILATMDSVASYCASRMPGGCVLNERLFISPKLENTQRRLPGALAHELSHLHMEQQLGMLNWHYNNPPWFQEGLATYVSEGAGAEKVSEDEAKEAILSGKTIQASDRGGLIIRKTASGFGLRHPMFYRQGAMFIKYLHDKNPEHYKQLLLEIEDGAILGEAMLSAYGHTVHDGWKAFVESINPKTSLFKDGDSARLHLHP